MENSFHGRTLGALSATPASPSSGRASTPAARVCLVALDRPGRGGQRVDEHRPVAVILEKDPSREKGGFICPRRIISRVYGSSGRQGPVAHPGRNPDRPARTGNSCPGKFRRHPGCHDPGQGLANGAHVRSPAHPLEPWPGPLSPDPRQHLRGRAGGGRGGKTALDLLSAPETSGRSAGTGASYRAFISLAGRASPSSKKCGAWASCGPGIGRRGGAGGGGRRERGCCQTARQGTSSGSCRLWSLPPKSSTRSWPSWGTCLRQCFHNPAPVDHIGSEPEGDRNPPGPGPGAQGFSLTRAKPHSP